MAEPAIKMMSLVTICHDRTGKVLSRSTELVPDDGRLERGARLLFDLVAKRKETTQ